MNKFRKLTIHREPRLFKLYLKKKIIYNLDETKFLIKIHYNIYNIILIN